MECYFVFFWQEKESNVKASNQVQKHEQSNASKQIQEKAIKWKQANDESKYVYVMQAKQASDQIQA